MDREAESRGKRVYFPLLSLIQYPIPFLKNNIPNCEKFLLVQLLVVVLILNDDTKSSNFKGINSKQSQTTKFGYLGFLLLVSTTYQIPVSIVFQSVTLETGVQILDREIFSVELIFEN